MKKYFTKYLPVESKPCMEESCLTHPCDGKCRSTKLFLCSRDIQVGDEVRIETEAVSQSYQSSIDGVGIVHSINNEHEILIYRDNGELLPFDITELTKVIGEVSPDAVWVEEGDEFDEEDIQTTYYVSHPVGTLTMNKDEWYQASEIDMIAKSCFVYDDAPYYERSSDGNYYKNSEFDELKWKCTVKFRCPLSPNHFH